jgi:ubiquitin C-terminal hydrolase
LSIVVDTGKESNLSLSLSNYFCKSKIDDAKCPCCGLSELTQFTKFNTFPKVLVVNIKNAFGGAKNKKPFGTAHFSFSKTINIINNERTTNTFSLQTAILYSGDSTFGHYTALVQHSGKWFSVSDDSVFEQSTSLSGIPCILFYAEKK